MMNQAGFSVFHAAVMGSFGYATGLALKVNPTLFACAGVISSIFFQVLNEGIEWAVARDDKFQQKSSDEQETSRRYSRYASIVVTSFFPGILAGINEPSKMTEFVKVSLTMVAMSLVSYLTARVGNYCFLGNRDISLLGVNRNKVW